MLGVFAEYWSTFLRVIAVLTAVAFAIPISLAPLAWARTLRRAVDVQADLAVYFDRCLGVVALVLSCAAWYAAAHADLQPFFYQMIIGIWVGSPCLRRCITPWLKSAE